jgi:hypothetical protein
MTTITVPSHQLRVQKAQGIVVLTLPIRTVSEPNVRDNRWRKASRTKDHRSVVGLALRPQVHGLGFPLRVMLTRISAGTLDDDNLRGALKACRDGVADALGLESDRDPRVTWFYGQAPAKRGTGAVEITVTRRPRGE